MTPMQRFLNGLRQAGAKMYAGKAEQKWRQVLEQRERNRERAELDELIERMSGRRK